MTRIALLGNPNTGKTTLFNHLCGLRHKVSNFPGTTQEARIGSIRRTGPLHRSALIDLPGAYSLELDQPESVVCRDAILGERAPGSMEAARPDCVVLVVAATHLARGLTFASEVLLRGVTTVVALTMMDEAERDGARIDLEELQRALGCPVVRVDTRRSKGVEGLCDAVARAIDVEGGSVVDLPEDTPAGRRTWGNELAARVTSAGPVASSAFTDRLDGVLTHPVLGLGVFAVVMAGVFYAVFKIAQTPMEWIDGAFSALATFVASRLGDGPLQALLTDGVIAGVGATVIFLPQICLLFFLIALLEESGYLARAAVMTDRWLTPFGLSGHSFVPLLSAHACALPAIAACRGIADRRDRLATILVAPFMSCTARIPVYVLLCVLLFPGNAVMQAVAFAGCYVFGIIAALVSSLIARRTIFRGEAKPITIEFPRYARPSLRDAFIRAWDAGFAFLKKAGTLILAVSIVLWWLSAYPTSGPSPRGDELRAQAAGMVDAPAEATDALIADAEAADASHAAQRSYLGRIGSVVQPVFEPLGFDRQLTIGVLASFAAREVFVSTMAIQIAGVDEMTDDGLVETMERAVRDDGVTPIFNPAVSWALLVYYVLAMQCIPTLLLTAREAGGWKWAGLQLGWMLALAWIGGMIAYQAVSAFGS